MAADMRTIPPSSQGYRYRKTRETFGPGNNNNNIIPGPGAAPNMPTAAEYADGYFGRCTGLLCRSARGRECRSAGFAGPVSGSVPGRVSASRPLVTLQAFGSGWL